MTMQLKPPPVSLLDAYTGSEVLPLYTTRVSVTGGAAQHGRASGRARSDEGALDLDLRLPKELGGPGGGTNPEQLFAAGYAACFHGALTIVATRAKVDIGAAEVRAIVSFGRDPADGLYLLTADIEVEMPGVNRARAEALVAETERICPYSKMTKRGIKNSICLK